MSLSIAANAARQTLNRAALTVAGVLALILSSTPAAQGQKSSTEGKKWELRLTGGAFVPVGGQRNFLDDADLTAAQLSWVVRPSLAITGSFGWARSRDLVSVDRPKLDVFTSDLGVEARPTEWFSNRKVTFSPFAGFGAGMRSYNYRKLDVDATNNFAGYATFGGEIGVGRVGMRLEVRDYATGFKPLVGAGKSDARNDLVMMVGLRFDRQHSSQD
jgi:hypothetical protein